MFGGGRPYAGSDRSDSGDEDADRESFLCGLARQQAEEHWREKEAEIVLGLDVTTILVTHDLPYALQLCERAVVLDGGRVVVDGPTGDVLADRETMAAHRLELPYGFDVPSRRAQ